MARFELPKEKFQAFSEICRMMSVDNDFLIVENGIIRQTSKNSRHMYKCDMTGIFGTSNVSFTIPQVGQKVKLFDTLLKNGTSYVIDLGDNGTHKISNEEIEVKIMEPLKAHMKMLVLSEADFQKRSAKTNATIDNGEFDKKTITTLDSLAQALESRRLFFFVENGKCYFQVTVADTASPTSAKTKVKSVQYELNKEFSGFFSLDTIKSCPPPVQYDIYLLDERKVILKLDCSILKGSASSPDVNMTIWSISDVKV